MATTGSKWSASGERRENAKKAAAFHGYTGITPRPAGIHQLKRHSLQRGIVYGPVESRRLGFSLGVNLLPSDYKLCSFNCIYCQYGWTKKGRPAPADQLTHVPSVDEIVAAITLKLEQLSSDGKTIDAITICANGEPTLYPNLTAVIEMAKRLRDQYQPQARLAILSNSSTVGNKTVREALDLLDVKIMKFDAGSEEMFHLLNHLHTPIYMGDIVAGLKEVKYIYLQSLFVQGRVTNADPDSIGLWIERVRDIRPLGVQVYTLDSDLTDNKIQRVSLTTLQWIADQVRWRAGVPSEVC
jgi:wyosine [tRNA(Phe)-imidazoG37] synthetase (radical SAM superfamily)